jgi:hypothetical protein
MVCNENNLSGTNCANGSACTSSFFSSGAEASCQHDTTGESQWNYTWYSFICDTENCSNAEYTNSPYYVNHDPYYNQIPNLTWAENTNQTLNLSLYFWDFDGHDLNFTYQKPDDITIYVDNDSHIVTFVPDTNFVGIRNMTVTAWDPFGLSKKSNLFWLNVSGIRDPPQFTTITDDNSIASNPTNMGGNITFTANATDPNNDSYLLLICASASVSGTICMASEICRSAYVANGTQASCQHNTTGEQSWTYTWYSFACDATTCSSAESTNSPYYVNHAPNTSTIPLLIWKTNINYTLNLTEYFTDPEGHDLNFTATEPQNVTVMINNETNIATLVPDTDFAGNTNVTFTAHDPFGLQNSSNLVLLNVTLNAIPYFTIVTDDNSTATNPTSLGENVTFTATASDPDTGNYTLLVCDSSSLSGTSCAGTQICNSSFVVSGAQASCEHSTEGEMSWDYSWWSFACDAENCSSAESTNSPYYVNHAPNTSTIANITWPEDNNYTLNMSLYFTDPEGHDLNFTTTEPQNITVIINNETNLVTLIPETNFNGHNLHCMGLIRAIQHIQYYTAECNASE